MDLFSLFSLISAGFAGASMGSFLLLTLLYESLLKGQKKTLKQVEIYRRFYRLNIILCLTGGLLAALIKNQQAALVLAILAASYVFCNMHILKGIISHSADNEIEINTRALNALYLAQNFIHVSQFIAAAWAIYLLNLNA